MGAYSVYFMMFNLHMDLLSGELVYLMYMFLCSTCFSIMCGTVAVFSSYLFVTAIYANIKGE